MSLVSEELPAPLLPCGLLRVCFCKNITPDSERDKCVWMRVRACVCIVCEQMCYTENDPALLRGIIGLTQEFLIPCSMCLPHHVPCICLSWGGRSSSLNVSSSFLPLLPLASYAFVCFCLRPGLALLLRLCLIS